MTDPNAPNPRYEDPKRPAVGSILPPLPKIVRPRLVLAVPILTGLSVLSSIPGTVLSYRHDKSVRHGLELQLAAKAKDYSPDDVRLAVLIGVLVVLVLGIIFVIAELRASVKLLEKRRGARVALLWLTLLHLPLIALSPQVRDLGKWDHLTANIQASCLILAVATAYLIPVGRWLTAAERQGPIPLRPSGTQGTSRAGG